MHGDVYAIRKTENAGPVTQLASYGGRSFAYAGPSNWNSLPAHLIQTIVFLFRLLSTTSKPFSSLSTRLARAARLEFFFTKTRYRPINSLLLLLLFFILFFFTLGIKDPEGLEKN